MYVPRRIKKSLKYRNLGGKTFWLEFEVKAKDIPNKIAEGNWACYNFIDRRPDFDSCLFSKKLYYGKVDNLGYIICEDELESVGE